MKLSTKCRYGLRAALSIARSYQRGAVKRKDIAASENISSAYLENILLVLRNHRILETTRGVKGGYVLSSPPSAVSVYDIVNALEGPLSVVDCVEGPESCEKSSSCISRSVWCELAETLRKTLEGITLQDLLDREKKGGTFDFSI